MSENKEKELEKLEIEAEADQEGVDEIDGLPRYQRAMARFAMGVGIIKNKTLPAMIKKGAGNNKKER